MSPIRPIIAGQNNIPMTYSGPPCRAEITRNHGKRDYTRNSFEFGYDYKQPSARQNSARKVIDRDNMAVGIRHRPVTNYDNKMQEPRMSYQQY